MVATYADRLKKRGHTVLIVSTPHKQPNIIEQFKSVVKGQGLLTGHRQTCSHLDHLDIDHKVLDKYRPVTDRDVPDADVIIATWWETAEWVAKLSDSKGIKVYFIQHHEVFDYLPKQRVEATYSLPFHKITIAQWLLDLMQTRYQDSDVSLVPNSVDTQQFYAPQRDKQPVPTVGMLYAPAYWKGCDICLKAVALASQSIPDLRLIVFGSHPISDSMPLPTKGSQFFFRPSQDEIRNLYAQCDVWLFGSRSEGFGLPILEAMACRTPVIGTPVGAAPELLEKGGGILVQPENPEDMSKAIQHVLTLSNSEWKSMSDNAWITANSYTWDNAAELFEAALRTAIKRQKQTPETIPTLVE